jgi:hypothetical protein
MPLVGNCTAVNTGGEDTNGEREHSTTLLNWNAETVNFGAAKRSVFWCIVFYLLELQRSFTSHGRTITQSAHVHPHAPQQPAMACML